VSDDVVVGALMCRLEKHGDTVKLYVMTIGVLEPYTRLGIGML